VLTCSVGPAGFSQVTSQGSDADTKQSGDRILGRARQGGTPHGRSAPAGPVQTSNGSNGDAASRTAAQVRPPHTSARNTRCDVRVCEIGLCSIDSGAVRAACMDRQAPLPILAGPTKDASMWLMGALSEMPASVQS